MSLLATLAAHAQTNLPDAPAPSANLIAIDSEATPPPASAIAVPVLDAIAQEAFPPEARQHPGLSMPGLQPTYLPLPRECVITACTQAQPLLRCCQPSQDIFSNYLKQNALHIYTPKELGGIAIRGVFDPFNLMTIGATSLLSVATDSHSAYGPAFHGWAKLSGVALTEDMTGEFVGTFLIPSIDHQDPHYHRLPNASLTRRVLHAAYQPFWTTSDTGKGMINYSTLVGSVVDEAVDMSYVPYQRQGWGPAAERISIGWTTAPVGNFVTEFFPDVARHINFKVVFLQRIVDRVAIENGGAQ